MKVKEVHEWVMQYLEMLMLMGGADMETLPGVITNAIIAYETEHKKDLIEMVGYPFPHGENVVEKSVKVTGCDKEFHGFCR